MSSRCLLWMLALGLGATAGLTHAQEMLAKKQWKYQVLHNFGTSERGEPWAPQAELIFGRDGLLYGTTYAAQEVEVGDPYGTAFRISQSGKRFKVLHGFIPVSDGSALDAGLVQARDGDFYGVTRSGGPNGGGTVFRISAAGEFQVIRAFDDHSDPGIEPRSTLLEASDGWLYGTIDAWPFGPGTVFRMSLLGEVQFVATLPAEFGAFGRCGLIEGSDGLLYGLMCDGAQFVGAMFAMTKEGRLAWARRFDCEDEIGCAPNRKLVELGDFLYGATSLARDGRQVANIFRVDRSGVVSLEYSTTPVEGTLVDGPLALGASGDLFGATRLDGPGACMFSPNACGTVFRFNPSTRKFSVLHSFTEPSLGGYPYAGVVIGADGALYGTTRDFGTRDGGVVFRLSPR